MSGSESEDNESDSPDENKRMSDDFFPGRGKMDIADNLLDAETLEIMANRHTSVQVILANFKVSCHENNCILVKFEF